MNGAKMFWKKKEVLESEEYKRLYHEIELIKIDIAVLQKRKQKKLPLADDNKEIPQENRINDGFDELRKLNKESNQY